MLEWEMMRETPTWTAPRSELEYAELQEEMMPYQVVHLEGRTVLIKGVPGLPIPATMPIPN